MKGMRDMKFYFFVFLMPFMVNKKFNPANIMSFWFRLIRVRIICISVSVTYLQLSKYQVDCHLYKQ
jgi:hypothetical protein